MHSFTIGQEYVRSQLLDFIGSKQTQTGVIWGNKEPSCLIVTSGGRHGKKAGYSDEALKNGCWWYFGQGQSGNHLTTNAANTKLIDGQRSVLLFTTREPTAGEVRQRGNYQKLFAFRGIFNVSSYDIVIPESGTRQGDKLFRFLLIPVSDNGFHLEDSSITVPSDLHSFRKELIAQVKPGPAQKAVTLSEYRYRSNKVRKYALLRANGKCEACGLLAPFIDDHGNRFLEVHHILRMADDGDDDPMDVAAICPNCHRRAHYSNDRNQFQQHLLSTVLNTENELEKTYGPDRK